MSDFGGREGSTHEADRGSLGVLALWIAVLAFAGPFAGKLGDVQHNRAVDYLPASADSTQVAKIQDQLPGGETTELVLVYHRDGGLSSADRAAASDQVADIERELNLVRAPEGVPSKSGDTVMYPVASTSPGRTRRPGTRS